MSSSDRSIVTTIGARSKRSPVGHHSKPLGADPPVSDPVHDEGLLPRLRGGGALVPESDEEIGAEAHRFPAEEHQEEVVRQDQREHREREEVQVSEVPAVGLLVPHVSHRVDVDQEAHARHDEHHHGAQRIEHEAHVRAEVPGLDPGVEALRGPALLGREREQVAEARERDCEGQAHRSHADDAGQLPWQLPRSDPVHEGAQQRQRRHQPEK